MKNNLTVLTLLSILSVIVITTSLNSIYAQENMTDIDEPKFFAIQHAESGSSVQIFDKMAYSLKLNSVSDKTILFSDRPDRIVTSMSTSDFVGNWSKGEDSFEKNPPNAVLVIEEQEQQDVAIVELFDPVYDSNTNMLEYNIHIDDTESFDLPKEFGQITIVIDVATYIKIDNFG